MALLWLSRDFAKAATKNGVLSVPREGLAQLSALTKEEIEKVAVHCVTAAGYLSPREAREVLKAFEGWIQTGDDRFLRTWRLVEGKALVEKAVAELGEVPLVPSEAAVEQFVKTRGLGQNVLVCEAAEANGTLFLAYWVYADGALVLSRTVSFSSPDEAAEDLWRTVKYCVRFSKDFVPLPLATDALASELAAKKGLRTVESTDGSIVLEGLSLLPVKQIVFVSPLDAKPVSRSDGMPVQGGQRSAVLTKLENSVLQELLGVKTHYRSSLRGVVRAASIFGLALLVGAGVLLMDAKSELEKIQQEKARVSEELARAQGEARQYASKRLVSLLGLGQQRKTRELVKAIGKVPTQVRLTKLQLSGGRIELKGEVQGTEVPEWGRVTSEGDKMIWLAEF
ncbi:MAG: hypothetical protein QXY39_02225 [Thermofilaceae archaeon]